ncbi:MAG: OsmC family protein, partial [Bacteroidota bacterium]|nr:OsmC family protein [Bacteroidota bacterium]
MATTSTIVYLGDLRTQMRHERSGETVITDAPLDNNGKGEAFSPTDLVATGLGSCMLTMMGIKARDLGIDLGSVEVKVE